MKKSFLFSLLMGIIFFVSCTTENVQLDQTAKQNSVLKQSNIVELSKLWTINNSDSLAILKGVQKIDWDNAVVSDTDKGEILEVPLILKNNLKVSYLETKNEVTNKLLFIKEASGKLNAYQMMIATKDKISSTDPSLSFSNLNSSFDGYVAFVNSSNKTVDLLPSVHRSKPLLTGREIESCTYLVQMYDDDTYRIISLLFCTFNGGSMASPIGGGGGGGSGASAPDKALCDANLSDITNQALPTSNFISSQTTFENSNTKTKQYTWQIFSCVGYSLTSYETSRQIKVANANPSLQWEFESLTHNNIASSGFVVGVDMSYMDISNLATVGKYNAIMSLKYSVKFSLACKGSPVTNELSFPANHNFSVND
jgi:hypothetical protein